jgi:tRNA threonylcarbamoyl adenosine modification protein YeaZ
VLQVDGAARRLVAREERMARGHAEALIPMVGEIMEEADLDFAVLDRIAASLGPGSFTGVRIAIAAARGLALVTPAKLWGTDSLTVMARSVLSRGAIEGGVPFAVAVDARADKLYFGVYDREGRKLVGPLLVSAKEAAAMLPDNLKIAVGNGALHLAEAAHQIGRRAESKLPDLEPDAAVLAELAFESGEILASLRPLYLRAPDAKPQISAGMMRR